MYHRVHVCMHASFVDVYRYSTFSITDNLERNKNIKSMSCPEDVFWRQHIFELYSLFYKLQYDDCMLLSVWS